MVQSWPISISSIGSDGGSAAESIGSGHANSISFADTPLTALSKNTRKQLSSLLNAKKILRSEEGYERDWRGIASLSQQKSICDENSLSGDDPMNKVLLMWCSNNPKSATFANLEHYLGIIDRWDVSDDIYENLVEDVKNYNTGLQQKTLLASSSNETDAVVKYETPDDYGNGSDPNILTKDDVLRAQKGLPPQRYDAFMLFADADINYAVEMLTKLEENPEYNFKLCIKDRDLLAGISFAHVALTQLIEERCKHLIVILTNEFMKSPENKFLVNYTQALQIQNKTRKIIPLIYEESVLIPRTLKIYTHLKYNASSGGLYNFWSKLAASIRNVNISTDSPPAYTKNISSVPAPRHIEQQKTQSSVSKLPTPPAELPIISINGDTFIPEDEKVFKKERNVFKKRSSLRSNAKTGKSNLIADNGKLRNAHSTSQLNASYRENNVSMSDLSTSSCCSDTKKKRKWPGKLFKKVFSRSSSKLQEPV